MMHRSVSAAREAVDTVRAPADAVRLLQDDAAQTLPAAPLGTSLRRQECRRRQSQGERENSDHAHGSPPARSQPLGTWRGRVVPASGSIECFNYWVVLYIFSTIRGSKILTGSRRTRVPARDRRRPTRLASVGTRRYPFGDMAMWRCAGGSGDLMRVRRPHGGGR